MQITPISSRIESVEQRAEELKEAKRKLLEIIDNDALKVVEDFIEAKVNFILRKNNIYYGAW